MLQIKKLSNKTWKHIDTNDGAFILTKFYAKLEFNEFLIVESYGSKRRKYLISDIEVYDIGGSAETFANFEDLFLRLEALKYTGFYKDGDIDLVWGSIIGTLSDQTDLQNALDSKLDKVTTTGVERVYTINSDGSQGTKPTSELAGSSDTYSYWFSYTASHVTSAILYTQVANAILATSGTQSLITRVGTNLYNSYHFLNWVSATANGSNAGVKINNNADVVYRAGVEAYIIFGNNSDNVNHVTAVGSYGLLSAVPNLDIANFTTDFVGVGNDPTDTNLSFYCKRIDATASYLKIPTNSNFPAHTVASDIFMLKFETNRVSVQADFQIKLTLTNLINGAVISHTFTGLECPDLSKAFINTVNRSNRNTGVATAIRWIKTHIKAKYF